MSINAYLTSLASNLVLSNSENESINISINALETRLESYFGNEIKEKFKFGSSTRGTILPRKADNNSDIDYMIVFDNPSEYTPQAFLNKLRNFAEKYYHTSELHQSSPTFVLELNHIRFELVPAYIKYNCYYISDGKGGWIYTNPNDINDDLISANNLNSSKVKPIIRLMKYWNINICNHYYSSYELEKQLISQLRYAYIICTSYTDYLKYVLQALRKNEFYGTTIYNKITNSINKIDDALIIEKEGKTFLAELKIKEVFPEV